MQNQKDGVSEHRRDGYAIEELAQNHQTVLFFRAKCINNKTP